MDSKAFKNHPVWATASSLSDALDDAEDRGDAPVIARLQQLRYLVAAIIAHHDADAAPYPKVGLDHATSLLMEIRQGVQNFANNGDVGHLESAYGHADNLLLSLGSWPTIGLKGGAAAAANRAFNEFRDSAEATISRLIDRNLALENQLENFQTGFQAQSRDLESQLSSMQERITQEQSRLDKSLTNMNELFTAKQTEREERFNEAVRRMANDYQAITDGRLATSFRYLESAKENFEAVNKLRTDTETVAGLASADILAGKFAEHSQKQWRWGIFANILGFAVLALGIFVLIRALQGVDPNESITWQFAALKLGVTATLVGTAAVAFRLGGRFLGQYTADKGLELELRSIGPFLADVDPGSLETAKIAYINRAFGARAETQPSPDGVPEMLELIRALAESAKKSGTASQ